MRNKNLCGAHLNTHAYKKGALYLMRRSRSFTSSEKNEAQDEKDLELLEMHDVDVDSYGYPSELACQSIPRKFRQASNSVLSIMAAQQVHGARKERLLREIIRIDKVSYPVARETLMEINKANDKCVPDCSCGRSAV